MAKSTFLSSVPRASQDQFQEFLEGHTYPAKFKLGDGIWVVRYLQDPEKCPRHNLWLASELVGYRIAKILDVPVPKFKIIRINESFKKSHQGNRERVVRAGPATACKWLEDAYYPNLENEPLDDFWKDEYYMRIVARARAIDTLIMNFDRRKKGNIVLTGYRNSRQVWFLDFDQSFLAKHNSPDHGYRLHWSEKDFRTEWLGDMEVLSGFDGTGDLKYTSLQRLDHFRDVLKKMENLHEEDLNEILGEIPSEWEICEKARQRWLNNFLYRRDIALQNIEKIYSR